MGYFNLIYQKGENKFLNNCKKSGVDGLIIVDLPYPETKFANKCKKKYYFYSTFIPYNIKRQDEKNYQRLV